VQYGDRRAKTGENSFDELTKGLANGAMSRRRALKLLVSTLLGGGCWRPSQMCRVPKSNRSGSRFGEETEGANFARTGRGCFSVAFLTSANTSEAANPTTAVGEEEAGAAEVATVTTVVGEAEAVGIVRREGRVAKVA
jgi:hypothetical protein